MKWAPDGKIKQKIILLTGNRPCFIDKTRDASIDSAQSIKVLLVPKLQSAGEEHPDIGRCRSRRRRL